MLVGVLSDTHDRLPTIEAALGCFAEAGVGTVLHAGDIVSPFAARVLAGFEGSLHVVYGNNDGERRGLKQILPQIQDGPLLLELGGRRVLLHHALEWCRPEQVRQADVIVTGHTHEVTIERHDGRLLVNPGECCGWITGRATCALLDVQAGEVKMIEIPT
jgi:putative phosphoesterase